MGRAIRFCSHKDLSNKRQFVDIFLYLAVYYSNKPPTIDDYIWKLTKKKQRLIKQFEDVLKEKAIDCELFYEGNNYKDDEKQVECDI